jgi:hypothetical protein
MINGATIATFQAIAGKLLPELLKHKDQILQAAEAASSVISTTEGDAGVVNAARSSGSATAGNASTFNARGILGGLLGDLSELSGAIPKDDKYAQHRGLLDQVVNTLKANHGEISGPQTRDLLDTIQHLANEPVDSGVQGNVQGDNGAPAELPKADSPKNDTDVVLENLLGFINTKLTKKNGHFYMALNWLGGPLNGIFKAMGMEFRLPSPEELPGKVQELIVNNKEFNSALRAVIENKEVDTSNMGTVQKWSLSGAKKLLGYLAKSPQTVLDSAPQAGYALRYGSGIIIPFIRKIPIVGSLLAIAYPFVADELSLAGEIKEKEYLSNILQVLGKNHKPGSAAPSTSGGTVVPEAELAGAVL